MGVGKGGERLFHDKVTTSFALYREAIQTFYFFLQTW